MGHGFCYFRQTASSLSNSSANGAMMNVTLNTAVRGGLISLEDGVIRLDGAYRFLVRTVAATFDSYLADSQRTFSKAA